MSELPAEQHFRGYLDTLARDGELLVVADHVEPDYELAACLSLLDAGPAVRFTDVGSSGVAVVGNLLNSRERIAAALGTSPSTLAETVAHSAAEPISPTLVDQAPWQAVVEPTDFRQLPVPRFFDRESAPYLTAGVILAHDVISGEKNMSFARFKIIGSDTAMLGVSPNHHLGRMVARAASIGRPLPICVAVGNHPSVMIAACLYLGYGDDEAGCAGALLGESLHMTTGPSNGIAAPTGSEMVFEAEVFEDERITEGPVSEYHGMYNDYGLGYLTRFGLLSRCADAQLQVIVPGLHQEHILLGGIAIAAGLQAHLRTFLPGVTAVAVPDTGSGRTAAVVALRDPRPGQALQAIFGCFARVPLIKQVVVVDDDLDVWNNTAVEWARMTRCRPERDIIIVPAARTDRSEPLQANLTVGKLGVDATRKAGDRAEGFDMARLPQQAQDRATALLESRSIQQRRSSLQLGIGNHDDD